MRTRALFPSRIHIGAGRLLDKNNYDIGTLRGFNVHVAATVDGADFVWSQADYTAMQALGATLVRHVIMWDVFEQSAGVFDAVALASLDTAIARAGAAKLYTVLSAPHLNVGRVPTWAQTTGNEWDDYIAHGQALIQMLAARYKGNQFVIGMYPNEPTTADLGHLMTGYQTTTAWHTGIATAWPVWINPTAYGNGTPSPRVGTQINPATIAGLDPHGHGVILEWHDYLNLAGSFSTDGYQDDGAIAPIQQASNFTAQYHGWGGDYNYPNTVQSRADFAAHVAPLEALVKTNAKFALAVGEFGMDSVQSGEPAFVADKTAAHKAAGAVVALCWVYDVNVSAEPFSARPSGAWRPSMVAWLS